MQDARHRARKDEGIVSRFRKCHPGVPVSTETDGSATEIEQQCGPFNMHSTQRQHLIDS